MSTLSVPISAEEEKFINEQVKSGSAANKAHVVRKALKLLAEEEAVQAILKAQREPSLKGDLDALAKRLRK